MEKFVTNVETSEFEKFSNVNNSIKIESEIGVTGTIKRVSRTLRL